MRDDGTFYIDKAEMRLAASELDDGRTFDFFLRLAVEAEDDGLIPVVSARDIAVEFKLPLRSVTAMLTDLDEREWIEWDRPRNQWADGSIRVLRDISWHGEVD